MSVVSRFVLLAPFDSIDLAKQIVTKFISVTTTTITSREINVRVAPRAPCRPAQAHVYVPPDPVGVTINCYEVKGEACGAAVSRCLYIYQKLKNLRLSGGH